LQWLWRDRNDYFVSGNLTVYYSPRQKKSEFFRGPDFFVAKDCDPNPNRRSWVVWHEDGKYPNFILEILSESTADMDRGEKKEIYQNIFRTPEYFLYEPETQSLEGYRLQGGRYVAIPTNDRGLIWSEQLELYLGVWDGNARFFNPAGDRVLMPDEEALLAMQQLEFERQRADRLADRLRSLGVEDI
jgi:Uma2 family endonuclease